jgi:hypothetical protein
MRDSFVTWAGCLAMGAIMLLFFLGIAGIIPLPQSLRLPDWFVHMRNV